MARRFGPPVHRGLQQRLDLGREANGGAVVCHVQRLDAERVPGQQQLAPTRVPECKGIHAAKVGEHLFAALRVELEQHFGVRLSPRRDAVVVQPGAQLLVIVDLAVEADPVAGFGVKHGLRAAFAQVDDGKAAMSEADAPVGGHPQAGAIRTARDHRVTHAQKLGFVDGGASARYAKAPAIPHMVQLSVSEGRCHAR